MNTSKDPYRGYKSLDEKYEAQQKKNISDLSKILLKKLDFKLQQKTENIKNVKFKNKSYYQTILIEYEEQDRNGKQREYLKPQKEGEFLFYYNEKGERVGKMKDFPRDNSVTFLWKNMFTATNTKLSQNVENITNVRSSLEDASQLTIQYRDDRKEKLNFNFSQTQVENTSNNFTIESHTSSTNDSAAHFSSYITTTQKTLNNSNDIVPTQRTLNNSNDIVITQKTLNGQDLTLITGAVILYIMIFIALLMKFRPKICPKKGSYSLNDVPNNELQGMITARNQGTSEEKSY